MITFFEKAKIFTPPLCRLMARKKGGRPMMWQDVCNDSLLNPVIVDAVSNSTSWDGIPFGVMHEFMLATKMDFCSWSDMHRAFEYLKSKPNFIHLRQSEHWKSYWLPMMIRWRRSYGVVNKQSKIWPPLRDLLIRTPLIK